MTRRPALSLALACTSLLSLGQTSSSRGTQSDSITLPTGTPFPVQIDQNLPMRAGTPVRAHLLYPVYASSTLILPAETVLLGSIVALHPDRSRRIHARLNLDFTPFHLPVVRFTQVLLADGTLLPLASDDAADGAPVFRIVAPPPATGSFLHRQFDTLKVVAKDRIHVITGPDKADRLKQLLYQQLPYHPERIVKDTAWTVEATHPLSLEQRHLPAPPAIPAGLAAATDAPPTWMVQAYLNQPLSSATSHVGQEIKATVAEPIFNADQSVAVPQGATLVGAVTKASPARRFGRTGTLSFSFRQLVLPGAEAQSVQTSLTGIDASSAAQLAMDSEGQVKPKPQDKLVVPFILLALAARPLDRDGGDGALGKNAVASNSLGIIGFIIGTAAQRPNIAAGIGYYGAALSIYSRIIARGKQVAFPRDTRIVLQTTARRSTPMRPDDAAPRTR